MYTFLRLIMCIALHRLDIVPMIRSAILLQLKAFILIVVLKGTRCRLVLRLKNTVLEGLFHKVVMVLLSNVMYIVELVNGSFIDNLEGMGTHVYLL